MIVGQFRIEQPEGRKREADLIDVGDPNLENCLPIDLPSTPITRT
jgi:hypothetical protein